MNKETSENTNLMVRLKAKLPALAVLSVVAGGAWVMINQSIQQSSSATVDVKVPKLSAMGLQGENAGGGPGGPPLAHKIYQPGHHADGAFSFALKKGVG